MNEENSVAGEVTEDSASFDEGWNDGESVSETSAEAATETQASETAETAEAAPEGTKAQTAQAETAQTAPAGEAAPETPEKAPEAAESAPAAQVRDNGQGEAARRLEALSGELESLGGMDAVRDVMGLMRELSQGAGMTLEQFADSTRASLISRRDKVDMAVATERARAERLEQANARRAAQEKERRAEEERRNADFAAFIRAYPGVQAKDIPQEVWQRVRGGQSLVTAYAVHVAAQARAEAERLRGELETERKNAANRQKAAPPPQSAGNPATGKDAFEEGWEME